MNSKKHNDIKKRKILFVCLGNICRSPSAEEITRTLAKERGIDGFFDLDSAGISSYHEGEMPDPRMRTYAMKRGYNLTHMSRPVRTEDFYDFDLIIGMDDRNIDKLNELAPGTDEMKKIKRMTGYCIKKVVDYVPDPYYDGGFDNVIDILEDACEGLLNEEYKKIKQQTANGTENTKS